MMVIQVARRPAPSGDFSTHRGDDRTPAPGRLRLVEEFANTHNHLRAAELLRTPDDLRRWLHARGLPCKAEPDERSLAAALALREALRGFLRRDPGAAPLLEAAWSDAHMELRVEPGARSLTLEPAAPGVQAALGQLVAILHEAALDGSLPRLRSCANDRCRWVFYDHSRNMSARWCSMEVCGTRLKARSYRARRAEARA
jgi:predicted RNA-binding Zn ribbon-like protein